MAEIAQEGDACQGNCAVGFICEEQQEGSGSICVMETLPDPNDTELADDAESMDTELADDAETTDDTETTDDAATE